MAKAPARRVVRHNTNLAEVGQAANIALQVMVGAGVSKWADLQLIDPTRYAHVIIDEHQQELLDRFEDILPHLSRSPMVTVFSCNICDRFAFIAGAGAPPARCNLTLGCTGRTLKSIQSAPKLPKVEPVADPRT